MVPMLTLASMFEEPSRGSKMRMYSPTGRPAAISMTSAFSSEAMAQSTPQRDRRWMSTRLAYSSSLRTSSPWTLVSPVKPSTSTNPALVTSREMILAERMISLNNRVKRPVAVGVFF